MGVVQAQTTSPPTTISNIPMIDQLTGGSKYEPGNSVKVYKIL